MVNSREYRERMAQDFRNHKSDVLPVCYASDSCELPKKKRDSVIVGYNESCDMEFGDCEVENLIDIVRKKVDYFIDDVLRAILIGG